MPARAKFKQGEFFCGESWINYSTQTARVLSLAPRISKRAVGRGFLDLSAVTASQGSARRGGRALCLHSAPRQGVNSEGCCFGV